MKAAPLLYIKLDISTIPFYKKNLNIFEDNFL